MLKSHPIEGGLKVIKKSKEGSILYESFIDDDLSNKSNLEVEVVGNGKYEKMTYPVRSFHPTFFKSLLSLHGFEVHQPVPTIKSIFNNTIAFFPTYLCLSHSNYVNNYNVYNGICVGSGSVDNNISTDYKLEKMIPNGTSSGSLYYGNSAGDSTFSQTRSESNPVETSIYSISRSFSNLSSGSINVTEIGISGKLTIVTPEPCLLLRDTKDSLGNNINITVNPGQVLNVKYNLHFNLSQGWTKRFGEVLARLNGSLTTYEAPTRTCTSRTNSTADSSRASLGCDVSEGDITAGGICGNGVTEVTQDDYNLVSAIPHGEGSGQLFYDKVMCKDAALNPSEIGSVVIEGNMTSYALIRDVYNRSSLPVTVGEIGWAVGNYGTELRYRFLINRKVLNPVVVLQPGESIQIQLIVRGIY